MKYNLLLKELFQYFINIVYFKGFNLQIILFYLPTFLDVERDKISASILHMEKWSRKAF